ncbi:MAG TPA: radical SAM protein [Chthoniobacterales bacterium]|nr:radical SAM protein [Chthoniobacterales bacterium]
MSKSMFGPKPTSVPGMEKDWARELARYGERTLKVVWDISNKCNLRCRMCHFSFDHVYYQAAHFTSPALFERMAASALPLAHTLILSAANEPLISPHFVDILRIAARYSVPELLFLTNGQLLIPKIADAILETGVTQVQISIDGATKETYEYIRRGAKFDRLVRNLEYLSTRKRQLGRSLPRLQFNVVLMRRNLEELPLFVDLAEKLGVEWIAARHLLMIKGLEMEQETLAHDRAGANLQFRRFFARIERSKTVTVIGFPDFFNDEPLAPEAASVRNQPDASINSAGSAQWTIWPIARIFRRTPAHDIPPDTRSNSGELAPLPFGWVDHPAQELTEANNAIQIEGWALDRQQIARVTIEREPCLDDRDRAINERWLVEVGEARIQNGSRPDVGRAFPQYPHAYRAGWSFELRREMVSSADRVRAVVHVIAHSVEGASAEIGKRVICFSSDSLAEPYLFCSKPFDSIFIDSKGDVRPYPDCRPEHPFGSLAEEGAALRDIWFGKDFQALRNRIINRDPPPMCQNCAYFINRNVDDPEFFKPR